MQHARELGQSVADADLWAHTQMHDLVIVTKDADFSARILITKPPPRVVHVRLGNMRLAEFHTTLAKVWPRVEALLASNKLVNVYADHLETVAEGG